MQRELSVVMACVAIGSASALADPVVPGATATLIGTLPPGYKPYTMDIGVEPDGPYAGRWLYFGSDNNAIEGVTMVRMRIDGGPVGGLHNYAAAVYDPDGVFIDRTGALTGDAGTVLLGCSNTSDSAGRIWQVDASAGDAGNGLATVRTYVNPMQSLNNCDTMVTDAQGRLYIDVPTHRQIARMVGLPVNGVATFQTFAALPASAGVLVHDGQGHIWSAGSDGVVRRMTIDGPGDTLPRPVDLSVNTGTGTECGLTLSRATPTGGADVWGGGLLAVRRGSGNGQLVRIGIDGSVAALGSGMGDVYGMRVDEQGVLYTADYTSGEVWKIEMPGGCGPADVGGPGGFAEPDGALDNNDFIAFINYFFTGDMRADFGAAGGVAGQDGLLDNNDFIAFITAFFEGC